MVSFANALHAAASAPRTTPPSQFTPTLTALMRQLQESVPRGSGLDRIGVPMSVVADVEGGKDPDGTVARWAAEDSALRA